MILNVTFIHIFEIITLFLVVGKLFQIRKLYRQSNTSSLQTKKSNIKASPSNTSRAKEIKLQKTNGIYNRFTENYSKHNLPLPEVSFTAGLPLPEVSYSSNDEGLHLANQKRQSNHKTILNNYIDDCFFESSPEVFHDAEVVEFKNYKIDLTAESEFITVVDEHDEVVRAFESLEKNICIVR